MDTHQDDALTSVWMLLYSVSWMIKSLIADKKNPLNIDNRLKPFICGQKKVIIWKQKMSLFENTLY